MRILNIAGMSLIALTHLLFLCFIVQEFCRTLRGKKHRADAPVFEGFAAAEEDEPYIPKLSADALQKLKNDPRITSRVRIPMRPGLRSLNLANAATIAVYDLWRQHDYRGGR